MMILLEMFTEESGWQDYGLYVESADAQSTGCWLLTEGFASEVRMSFVQSAPELSVQ